ncbi:MAG TPA: extracellular solute-binding protein [Myxococcales bacterium]|nr:extracellular solute-binding protein [Myxococcales bacterium]
MPASLLALSLCLAAPRTVALWHSYRADEARALSDLADRFNRSQSEYRLELLSIPYDAVASKVSAAIPRGHGPDLFVFAHERLGGWAEGGLLAPVSLQPGRFLPGTAEAFQWKGRQLGAPLAFKTLALFYNRRLLPTPPATTDEVLADAVRLTDPGAGRFGLAYQSGDFYYHVPWIFGFGGSLFDARGRLDIDTAPVAASLRFVADLQARGLIPQEATSALVTQLFAEGKAAMAINGPWFLGELPKGLDYGVAPLPVVSATGLPAKPFLTVEGLFVSANAREPDGAAKALAFLTSDEAALTRAREARQLVANRAAYLDPQVAADPVMTAFRTAAERAVPMSTAPVMQLLWEPAQGALRAALRGEDPRDALRNAGSQLRALQRPAPATASPWPTLAFVLALVAAIVAWERRRRSAAEPARWDAYAFVLPAAIATVALVLFPILFSLGLSCFHRGLDGSYRFVGLGNFTDILASRGYAITEPLSFYFTLAVTLLWTAVNLAFHVGLGVALALLLHASWLRLRPLFRVLLIVPWAVPNYLTALIWKGLFHRQFGAINGLLVAVGLPRISWFSHFSTSFAADVCTNVWLGFPFMMVVALGALSSIPRELYDAAALDGAGPWNRFRHVTWPLLRPALLPAVILGGVWTFNMFNVIWLVSGGEPGGSTDILISEAYRWAFARQGQYGYAAAYSAIIFVLLAGYAVGAQKLLAGREART